MKKIITSCTYRHPSMELSEFSSDYLTNVLDTLSSENKTVILLGDFNADLLKYDQNSIIWVKVFKNGPSKFLGSLEKFALCYQLQVNCIDFWLSKTEYDGLAMC